MTGIEGAPIAPVPPTRGTRVTPSGDRKGAGVGAFLLAIVTAGALAHVTVRLKGLEVAYALGRERRISSDLEEQRRRLQIEIGMLKDPGRVVMIARDKLKMGPPAAEAIVALGSGPLVPRSAAPAPAPARGSSSTAATTATAAAAAAGTARSAGPQAAGHRGPR